ncbi:ABC transporter substrate-binding protein [Candidatus Bipolaricaulota bacterium]
MGLRKLAAWLAILALGVTLIGAAGFAQEVKNPDTLVTARPGAMSTLDPHFVDDIGSSIFLGNIYSGLLRHPRGGSVNDLEPDLATIVPSYENLLIQVGSTGLTFVDFQIRRNVKFHNGATLTLEDVLYTFRRILVTDVGFGADFREILLGNPDINYWLDEVGLDGFWDAIIQAIQVKSGNVVEFRLPKPNVVFLNFFADGGRYNAIMNEAWCIEQGCWPGTKESIPDYAFVTKADNPLHTRTNGTGPFKLASWDIGSSVTLERFDDYWEGPAPLKTVIRRTIPEWGTARSLLEQGDVDIVSPEPWYIPQLIGLPGVNLTFRDQSLTVTFLLMNQNIDPTAASIGSGELDGQGIPPNFFSDLDIRKAFNYAFDREAGLEAGGGLGVIMKTMIPPAVDFYDENQPYYTYDPDKAIEHFKAAWGGEVWEKGFKFTFYWSSLVPTWEAYAQILEAGVEAINPKFQIEVQGLEWPSYLDGWWGGLSPFGGPFPGYVLGNIYTSTDATMVASVMSSSGAFGGTCGYSQLAREQFDPLLAQGVETFELDARQAIYEELQHLCYENALIIPSHVGGNVFALRDWVQGFYMLDSWRRGTDFYTIWKGYP